MSSTRRSPLTLRRVTAMVAALAAAAMGYVALHAALLSLRALHPPRSAPIAAPAGYREVELTTADGVRLSAWWRPPRNGAAVVLVHGLGADRAQLLPQAAPLGEAGFGVLLLDLRAHGRSGGAGATWGARERLDADAGARFALAQPSVRPGAVGAVGFSIGATAVAGAAADEGRFRAVALEAMSPSAEEDVRTTFSARGPLSALPAVWAARLAGVPLDEARPAARIRELRPRPVLLVYGEADPAAPAAIGRALREALGEGAQLLIVPGEGHGAWQGEAGRALGARLVAFFTGALGAGG
jgi:dipeptidyl aminopeptidase/acylaminoacyl peptidase